MPTHEQTQPLASSSRHDSGIGRINSLTSMESNRDSACSSTMGQSFDVGSNSSLAAASGGRLGRKERMAARARMAAAASGSGSGSAIGLGLSEDGSVHGSEDGASASSNGVRRIILAEVATGMHMGIEEEMEDELDSDDLIEGDVVGVEEESTTPSTAVGGKKGKRSAKDGGSFFKIPGSKNKSGTKQSRASAAAAATSSSSPQRREAKGHADRRPATPEVQLAKSTSVSSRHASPHGQAMADSASASGSASHHPKSILLRPSHAASTVSIASQSSSSLSRTTSSFFAHPQTPNGVGSRSSSFTSITASPAEAKPRGAARGKPVESVTSRLSAEKKEKGSGGFIKSLKKGLGVGTSPSYSPVPLSSHGDFDRHDPRFVTSGRRDGVGRTNHDQPPRDGVDGTLSWKSGRRDELWEASARRQASGGDGNPQGDSSWSPRTQAGRRGGDVKEVDNIVHVVPSPDMGPLPSVPTPRIDRDLPTPIVSSASDAPSSNAERSSTASATSTSGSMSSNCGAVKRMTARTSLMGLPVPPAKPPPGGMLPPTPESGVVEDEESEDARIQTQPGLEVGPADIPPAGEGAIPPTTEQVIHYTDPIDGKSYAIPPSMMAAFLATSTAGAAALAPPVNITLTSHRSNPLERLPSRDTESDAASLMAVDPGFLHVSALPPPRSPRGTLVPSAKDKALDADELDITGVGGPQRLPRCVVAQTPESGIVLPLQDVDTSDAISFTSSMTSTERMTRRERLRKMLAGHEDGMAGLDGGLKSLDIMSEVAATEWTGDAEEEEEVLPRQATVVRFA